MRTRLDQRTDVQLLRQVPGNDEAFRVFYDRYSAMVERWFARQLGDHNLALDLCAETFAQALEGAARFRPVTGDTAAPWLFGIAANLLRRFWRTRRLETSARNRLGVLASTTFVPDPATLVVKQIELDQSIVALRVALASLPEGQRRATELRVLQELSYSEIAEQLDCSETAVRVRVSRGLRVLRAHLTKGVPDGSH